MEVRRWGKRTVLGRFFSKIGKVEKGCWFWRGSKDKNGYGKFTIRKKTVMAHRFAYEAFRSEIPEGLTCDHLCRQPSCVNPWHIELVSMRENLLRGDTFQAKNARKTHCPQGHEYSETNTYKRPDGGRGCRECMRAHSRKWKETNV